jgi:hypothetical protein
MFLEWHTWKILWGPDPHDNEANEFGRDTGYYVPNRNKERQQKIKRKVKVKYSNETPV